MSQMLVRESSAGEAGGDTSNDGNLSCDWGKDDLNYADKLAKSTDKVD